MGVSENVSPISEGRPHGERLSALEMWTTGHEKQCADRYRMQLLVMSALLGVLISIAGYGLVKTQQNQEEQTSLLRSAVSEINATPAPVPGYYRNCAQARASGAAPVFSGDPGYGAHLDRDGDGVGCE